MPNTPPPDYQESKTKSGSFLSEFGQRLFGGVMSIANAIAAPIEFVRDKVAPDGYFDSQSFERSRQQYENPPQPESTPSPPAQGKYGLETMRYPTEVQVLESDIKHWVTFHISEVDGSKYEKSAAKMPQDQVDRIMRGSEETKRAVFSGFTESGKKYINAAGALQGARTTGAALSNGAGLAEAVFKGAVVMPAVEIGAATLAANVTMRPTYVMLKKTISLYMPNTVLFPQNIRYQDINVTESMGAAGVLGQSNGLFDKGEFSLDNLIQTITSGKNLSASGTEAYMRYLSMQLGRTGLGIDFRNFQELALRRVGAAVNPQLEMVFKQVERRQYEFEFDFIARSRAEGEQIREIIRAFRAHAMPSASEASQGTRYFTMPSQFDVRFWFNGESGPVENPFLPRLGTCVLTAVDLDYSRGGEFATFEDGHPVQIRMQLRLKEIDIMTRESIEAGF